MVTHEQNINQDQRLSKMNDGNHGIWVVLQAFYCLFQHGSHRARIMNALQMHELGQKEANELRMLILRAPRILRDRRNPLEEDEDAEF